MDRYPEIPGLAGGDVDPLDRDTGEGVDHLLQSHLQAQLSRCGLYRATGDVPGRELRRHHMEAEELFGVLGY